jgi:ubiquinone/menaquinone biosynthesis C-methylase UbiE
MPTILDWGCGTGRIVQNLFHHHPYLLLYGADINAEMIIWNNQNIKGVHFSPVSIQTPTNYPSNYFDLIYGISVFTHLPANLQFEWINEIYRITKPSGIFLITTMGTNFTHQLNTNEKKVLQTNGILEKAYQEKKIVTVGDRNFSVYETAAFIENLIKDHFNILQFYDGSQYPEKFGGQDLWILQKK